MAKRHGHISQDTLRKAVELLDERPPDQKDDKKENQQPPAEPQPEAAPTTVH